MSFYSGNKITYSLASSFSVFLLSVSSANINNNYHPDLLQQQSNSIYKCDLC